MRFASDTLQVMGRGRRRIIDMRPRARNGASSTASFSGRGWSPDGRKTTGLDSDSTKPWVKFDKTTYVFSEQAGPPSYPWPDTEVWFEKAYTYGDIVITARM